MNAQAVPILLMFLTAAFFAAYLMRRAFGALDRQKQAPEAEPLSVASEAGKPDHDGVRARSAS